MESRSVRCGVQWAAMLVILCAGCDRRAESKHDGPAAWQAADGKPAVELTIDYGDGMQKRFARIPHEEGMTVLAALNAAASHSRGIKFNKTGSGEAAMLTAIDGVANEAGGDENRNWMYRVNGKLATVSFDAYTLEPGDVILWRFEKFDEASEAFK
jgi:uncharacterized protein DUF4430